MHTNITIEKRTATFPWRFILIAFGISWACWFFVALTGRNIFTDLEVGIVAVLGGFGPAIAGILMVYRTNDEAFIRDYGGKRLVREEGVKS